MGWQMIWSLRWWIWKLLEWRHLWTVSELLPGKGRLSPFDVSLSTSVSDLTCRRLDWILRSSSLTLTQTPVPFWFQGRLGRGGHGSLQVPASEGHEHLLLWASGECLRALFVHTTRKGRSGSGSGSA
jgi:hypothetical protein